MKLFTCDKCGQIIYFENSHCERCSSLLGFDPYQLALISLAERDENTFTQYGSANHTGFRYCKNHQYHVCNWLVYDNSSSQYCFACSLNHYIPDISKVKYLQRWNIIENAKHRLIYSLLRLQLPLVGKLSDARRGLSFDFIAEDESGLSKKVYTGHEDGLITINIAEADDIEREMARNKMDEVYRTVLGHFRHEIGHYYWDILIENTSYLQPFQKIFGDDTRDYTQALNRHYKSGPPADWNFEYISAYATMHPWEDWAETWAHYMHIMDTMETAFAFGLKVQPEAARHQVNSSASFSFDPYNEENFSTIIDHWLPLTFSLNALNRSMGLRDLYPFIIRPKVAEKLSFIHALCRNSRGMQLRTVTASMAAV